MWIILDARNLGNLYICCHCFNIFPVYRVFILVHRGDVYKQGIIWMQFDFLTWYSVYMDTDIYSEITFLLFFFNHRNFYLSI